MNDGTFTAVYQAFITVTLDHDGNVVDSSVHSLVDNEFLCNVILDNGASVSEPDAMNDFDLLSLEDQAAIDQARTIAATATIRLTNLRVWSITPPT